MNYPVSDIASKRLGIQMRHTFQAAMPVGMTDPAMRETIVAQMDRILSSKIFSKSPRLSQLFRFAVGMSVSGNGHLLKEYTIAVDVFNRPETFDCRMDSIVRVEAARLRKKLAQFYQSSGSEDRVILTLPESGYEPLLHLREISVSNMPVIALLGEENCSSSWIRPRCDYQARVISFSKDSFESFEGTLALVVVFLGTAEKHATFEWVLKAVSHSSATVLFVSSSGGRSCPVALSEAIKALADSHPGNGISTALLSRQESSTHAANEGSAVDLPTFLSPQVKIGAATV